MRIIVMFLLALVGFVPGGVARADKAGAFDYYILSLSWSPNWCATTGDAQRSTQCDRRHQFGWVLHGLWPQYERGHPSYCHTAMRPPSRGETRAMADIMGTGGLAWHQWKKHGSCSGLSAQQYFATARRAYNAVKRPPVLRKLDQAVKLRPSVIEQAFLQSNPGWQADMLTITCKRGYIQEVRLCLTKDLKPRKCGADAVRDCRLHGALFQPIR
ncbi:MAG: ribonuclease T [Rhodobacterales bacterium]|nr:MAG: ribonuclease T [Rhodobacterales bacterium]